MKKLKQFEASEYLHNDELIAQYLTECLEDKNPKVFLAALGDVAKAKGMSRVAKDSGLGRESLYKALSPGAKPRYETIQKVLSSLGVQISFTAIVD